jgi:hypothetical protein
MTMQLMVMMVAEYKINMKLNIKMDKHVHNECIQTLSTLELLVWLLVRLSLLGGLGDLPFGASCLLLSDA